MTPLEIDLVLTVKSDGTQANLECLNKITGMRSAIRIQPDHIPAMAYLDLAEAIATAEAAHYTDSAEAGVAWAKRALSNIDRHSIKTYRSHTY